MNINKLYIKKRKFIIYLIIKKTSHIQKALDSKLYTKLLIVNTYELAFFLFTFFFFTVLKFFNKLIFLKIKNKIYIIYILN